MLIFSDPVVSGCCWRDPHLAELLHSTYALNSVFCDHFEGPKDMTSLQARSCKLFLWTLTKKDAWHFFSCVSFIYCWGPDMPVRSWFISNIHDCTMLVMLISRCNVKAHITNFHTIGLGHSSRNLYISSPSMFLWDYPYLWILLWT